MDNASRLLDFGSTSSRIVKFTTADVSSRELDRFIGESDRLLNADLDLPLVFDLTGVKSISADVLRKMAELKPPIERNIRERDGELDPAQMVIALCHTPELVALKVKMLGLKDSLTLFDGSTISVLMS